MEESIRACVGYLGSQNISEQEYGLRVLINLTARSTKGDKLQIIVFRYITIETFEFLFQSPNEVTQMLTAWLLFHLTIADANSTEVLQSNLLPHIVVLLQSENNDVVEKALWLITNLSLNTQFSHLITPYGAADVLTNLLESHTPLITQTAAQPLRNLLHKDTCQEYDENQRVFTHAGGMKLVKNLLASYPPPSEETLLWLTSILHVLSIHNAIIRRIIGAVGILQPLVELLSANTTSDQIKEQILKIFVNMSLSQETEKSFISANATKPLVDVLLAADSGLMLKQLSLSTLANLTCNDEIRLGLRYSGISVGITELLSVPTNPEIEEVSVIVVANIAIDDVIRLELLDAGVPAVVELFANSTIPAIAEAAETALTNLELEVADDVEYNASALDDEIEDEFTDFEDVIVSLPLPPSASPGQPATTVSSSKSMSFLLTPPNSTGPPRLASNSAVSTLQQSTSHRKSDPPPPDSPLLRAESANKVESTSPRPSDKKSPSSITAAAAAAPTTTEKLEKMTIIGASPGGVRAKSVAIDSLVKAASAPGHVGKHSPVAAKPRESSPPKLSHSPRQDSPPPTHKSPSQTKSSEPSIAATTTEHQLSNTPSVPQSDATSKKTPGTTAPENQRPKKSPSDKEVKSGSGVRTLTKSQRNDLMASGSLETRTRSGTVAPTAATIRRERISKEIFDTEQSYVKQLGILIKVYLNPLVVNPPTPPILSEETVGAIFLNIQRIFRINCEFLKKLKTRLAKSGPDTILGDLFLWLWNETKVVQEYAYFINNFNTSQNIAEDLAAKSPRFKDYLEKCKQHEQCRNSTLGFFLIMPIQRVPRYIMLLTDLVKNTTEDHPDYGDLVKALEKTKQAADALNDAKRQSENAAKVTQIQAALQQAPEGFTLTSEGRRLIKEGSVLQAAKKGSKYCYIMLFTDQLLFTRQQKAKYVFQRVIPLTELKIVDIPPNETGQQAFMLLWSNKEDSNEKDVNIVCSDKEQKDLWFQSLKDAITTQKKVLFAKKTGAT